MLLENSTTFYDRQIILLNISSFKKFLMSNLSIIGILEKLDNLNKSNPLKYLTNGSKNKKRNFAAF